MKQKKALQKKINDSMAKLQAIKTLEVKLPSLDTLSLEDLRKESVKFLNNEEMQIL